MKTYLIVTLATFILGIISTISRTAITKEEYITRLTIVIIDIIFIIWASILLGTI